MYVLGIFMYSCKKYFTWEQTKKKEKKEAVSILTIKNCWHIIDKHCSFPLLPNEHLILVQLTFIDFKWSIQYDINKTHLQYGSRQTRRQLEAVSLYDLGGTKANQIFPTVQNWWCLSENILFIKENVWHSRKTPGKGAAEMGEYLLQLKRDSV